MTFGSLFAGGGRTMKYHVCHYFNTEYCQKTNGGESFYWHRRLGFGSTEGWL